MHIIEARKKKTIERNLGLEVTGVCLKEIYDAFKAFFPPFKLIQLGSI